MEKIINKGGDNAVDVWKLQVGRSNRGRIKCYKEV